MSYSSWPASIPQEPLSTTWKESVANQKLVSQMDAGPPKQRRRFTAGIVPVSFQMAMTGTELETFKDWYNDDLAAGSLRFSWTHPRKKTICLFQFTDEMPSWEYIGGEITELWLVNISLNELP